MDDRFNDTVDDTTDDASDDASMTGLAVEEDRRHGGAQVAVLPAVRLAVVGAGAEGLNHCLDVARRGVGGDHALDEAVAHKRRGRWVVEQMVNQRVDLQLSRLQEEGVSVPGTTEPKLPSAAAGPRGRRRTRKAGPLLAATAQLAPRSVQSDASLAQKAGREGSTSSPQRNTENGGSKQKDVARPTRRELSCSDESLALRLHTYCCAMLTSSPSSGMKCGGLRKL